MVRTARRYGETGFYHVVTKGDGGQVIFENDRDRRFYLQTLEKCIAEHEVKLHAYCLMSNHVHLLVECEPEALSAFMKQLDETYAMRFRFVSQRKGHVFDGRFWSEPIENDAYFLSCLCYIHANPEHAGIYPASKYPWSSYSDYVGRPGFVHTETALEMIGGREAFKRFSEEGCRQAVPFAKSKLAGHLQPDEAIRVAEAAIGRDVLTGIRTMGVVERRGYIKTLVQSGLTEREIARVTGLGKTTVHRAIF